MSNYYLCFEVNVVKLKDIGEYPMHKFMLLEYHSVDSDDIYIKYNKTYDFLKELVYKSLHNLKIEDFTFCEEKYEISCENNILHLNEHYNINLKEYTIINIHKIVFYKSEIDTSQDDLVFSVNKPIGSSYIGPAKLYYGTSIIHNTTSGYEIYKDDIYEYPIYISNKRELAYENWVKEPKVIEGLRLNKIKKMKKIVVF